MRKNPSLPPERSLGYQVRRCHRMFDRILGKTLSRHEMNSGFWYYLRALWIHDGLTQKELSDVTHVTENTTASMINQMIDKGLVERRRDAGDRRKLRISLTAHGRRLESQLLPYGFRINAIAASGIPAAQLETCLAVLARMGQNMQRALDDGMEDLAVAQPAKRRRAVRQPKEGSTPRGLP